MALEKVWSHPTALTWQKNVPGTDGRRTLEVYAQEYIIPAGYPKVLQLPSWNKQVPNTEEQQYRIILGTIAKAYFTLKRKKQQ